MRIDHRDRKYSLGGSDAGAVVWLNPYESAFDVWAKKTGAASSDFREQKFTYWGRYKEKVIAEHYAARHCVELIESPKRVADSDDWMSGTPDRLIVAPVNFNDRPDLKYLGVVSDPVSRKTLVRRGLEIKTALSKHAGKWHADGCVSIGDAAAPVVENFEAARAMVPLYYWFQCQWYMSLMDFPEWDLCVLLDSSDYREYRIKHDAAFMTKALDACKQFWNSYIKTEQPPPIDWGKTVNGYLESLYGEHTDEIRPATEDENEKAKLLQKVGMQLKELISEEARLRQEIQALQEEHASVCKELDEVRPDNDSLCAYFRDRIGSSLGIEAENGTITWKKSGNQARTLRKKWSKS